MRNLNPIGFIVAVIGTLIFFVGMELYKSNQKYKCVVTQNNVSYRTEKIDSISKGAVYFKDHNDVNVIVNGTYTIRQATNE